MKPDDDVQLRQMLEAIEAAQRFIEGRSRDDPDRDQRFALVRALEVIAEAAAKVSDETQMEVALPWPAIVGMRNRPVHAYFDIDKDVLWRTAVQSLPQLGTVLREALARQDGAAGEA